MNDRIATIRQSMMFTGHLENDVIDLLSLYNCPKTAEHSLRVGDEASRLAAKFGGDPEAARTAGLLHDISAIIPNNERIRVAQELHIEILPEEALFPMIIHQKISRIIARDVFHIHDPSILDAIECHTTLKAKATLMDLVLFVADKIEWDQPGKPPYLEQLLEQLDTSLEQGAFVYIAYLWNQRDRLKVVHPWLISAFEDLKAKSSAYPVREENR
ncbi:HD domain-containing protein [Paenibacillus sp. H1-7]|uniref:bis(5'-nucleosyl)-tetraphosphatase (symmetrical) YqeK n=1 Tax=Paenibacillus sp. H1-7 TaxID=2282849 RepID=UPI001EF8909B|nr:bis(5'-nucleosyl)-tetraphosphatase (symmetrical) YqeK [Paenibacillus sp. H1-7]ULL13552.1 HD domain-containing protein [Paenibacillus sp. H1-7]